MYAFITPTSVCCWKRWQSTVFILWWDNSFSRPGAQPSMLYAQGSSGEKLEYRTKYPIVVELLFSTPRINWGCTQSTFSSGLLAQSQKLSLVNYAIVSHHCSCWRNRLRENRVTQTKYSFNKNHCSRILGLMSVVKQWGRRISLDLDGSTNTNSAQLLITWIDVEFEVMEKLVSLNSL